jgi:hypothetical protein
MYQSSSQREVRQREMLSAEPRAIRRAESAGLFGPECGRLRRRAGRSAPRPPEPVLPAPLARSAASRTLRRAVYSVASATSAERLLYDGAAAPPVRAQDAAPTTTALHGLASPFVVKKLGRNRWSGGVIASSSDLQNGLARRRIGWCRIGHAAARRETHRKRCQYGQ